MKKQLLSHVIHIMSTIPSIIHSGNPHNSFQSSVARFYLAELSDEWLDPCKVWGSYTPKCSHLMAQVCRKAAFQVSKRFMRYTWQMPPLTDSFHVQNELCYLDQHQGKVWQVSLQSNEKLASLLVLWVTIFCLSSQGLPSVCLYPYLLFL